MKKELQQYLDMPDDKLEKTRKQFTLCLCLALLAIMMMIGLFFFFHFYAKNYNLSIVFLFAMVCCMSGSLFSRQTLRYIELVQELKKLKSNKKDCMD